MKKPRYSVEKQVEDYFLITSPRINYEPSNPRPPNFSGQGAHVYGRQDAHATDGFLQNQQTFTSQPPHCLSSSWGAFITNLDSVYLLGACPARVFPTNKPRHLTTVHPTLQKLKQKPSEAEICGAWASEWDEKPPKGAMILGGRTSFVESQHPPSLLLTPASIDLRTHKKRASNASLSFFGNDCEAPAGVIQLRRRKALARR
ncbi:hypothetical protein BS50DRAFT_584449 [Corynespora cassiicola Philippines]|uniref:Uncharacterized protein n=1 Tax=Corynespora cassiicola Philippines TaxID=1448308 RepID=A0A2T2NZN9_CORCC|nr:hypothetical protein BS50DRAFT_584449 [Corynespora cassiicola Philippines]